MNQIVNNIKFEMHVKNIKKKKKKKKINIIFNPPLQQNYKITC